MKIEILKPEIVLSHSDFSYLLDEEKADIVTRALKSLCIVVSVQDDQGEEKLCSVIDFQKKHIHVREVCGKEIVKFIKGLEIFCVALAKRYKKDFVSFCTSQDGIKMIGHKMGYEENAQGEFEKAVI